MRFYDDDEELTTEERHERELNDLACLWDDSDEHLMPRTEREFV